MSNPHIISPVLNHTSPTPTSLLPEPKSPTNSAKYCQLALGAVAIVGLAAIAYLSAPSSFLGSAGHLTSNITVEENNVKFSDMAAPILTSISHFLSPALNATTSIPFDHVSVCPVPERNATALISNFLSPAANVTASIPLDQVSLCPSQNSPAPDRRAFMQIVRELVGTKQTTANTILASLPNLSAPIANPAISTPESDPSSQFISSKPFIGLLGERYAQIVEEVIKTEQTTPSALLPDSSTLTANRIISIPKPDSSDPSISPNSFITLLGASLGALHVFKKIFTHFKIKSLSKKKKLKADQIAKLQEAVAQRSSSQNNQATTPQKTQTAETNRGSSSQKKQATTTNQQSFETPATPPQKPQTAESNQGSSSQNSTPDNSRLTAQQIAEHFLASSKKRLSFNPIQTTPAKATPAKKEDVRRMEKNKANY